jgi:hypothetical protein
MIHPVTVKSPTGKVLRVITTASLEERSDAICQGGDGHFSSHKLRDDLCGREVCRKPFWTRQRGKKYCSRECTNIVARATALATKARQREKKLKERENQ